MIRLALVAPNPALRVGLRGILRSDPDLAVTREAGELEEIALGEADIDVLILASAAEGGLRGLSVSTAVLLLTDHPETAQAVAYEDQRVWGVLPLNAGEEEILAAVRALGEGLWVGSPTLVRGLLRRPLLVEAPSSEMVIEPVTRREMEVLQSVAQGLSNKQIALSLGISEHTVKFHLSSLYAKLGATNRTEAVRIGTQQGLIVL